MRRTIDQLLDEARRGLTRLDPADAARAAAGGRLLVDIRGAEQVEAQGVIPQALWITRSVLEWRVDPASGYQHPEIAGREDQVILICAEGYQSSLAAANLHALGFTGVTDVVGGFVAWKAAGLPVEQPRADRYADERT